VAYRDVIRRLGMLASTFLRSCTPASPRSLSGRRNAVQNAPSSESPTPTPSTSRWLSPATPVGVHLGDDAAVDAGLAVGGIQEREREGLAGQGAVRERRHLTVEVDADAADLALANLGLALG
jgi:hypothetical protein